MSITTRFIRLFKADIHGVMDHLEDKSLLLKQHLREMEDILLKKEGEYQKLLISREHVMKEYERYDQEIQKLEKDISLAIEKDKEDIAKVLIKKLKPISFHQEELDRQKEYLDQNILKLKEIIETQRLQLDQLRVRASDYLKYTKNQSDKEDIERIIHDNIFKDFSEEEIELDFIKRKSALKGAQK